MVRESRRLCPVFPARYGNQSQGEYHISEYMSHFLSFYVPDHAFPLCPQARFLFMRLGGGLAFLLSLGRMQKSENYLVLAISGECKFLFYSTFSVFSVSFFCFLRPEDLSLVILFPMVCRLAACVSRHVFTGYKTDVDESNRKNDLFCRNGGCSRVLCPGRWQDRGRE